MSRVKVTRSKLTSDIIELAFLLAIVFLVRTYGFGLYQVPSGSMETTMLVGERFYADKFSYAFLNKPQVGDVIAFNDPRFVYSKNPIKRWFEYYCPMPFGIVPGPANFTKRIIGGPGDHIKGVVEDGKPVIYRNEQKMDEPYLNKYPIILVFKNKSASLMAQLDTLARCGFEGCDEDKMPFRSYDPSVSWEKQKFYHIDPANIVIAPETGAPVIRNPGEPVFAGTMHGPRNMDEFDIKLGDDEYWVMGDNRRGSGDSRFFGPIHRTKTYIHAKILYRIWSIDSDAWFWVFDLIQHPIDFFKRVRWDRFFQRVV